MSCAFGDKFNPLCNCNPCYAHRFTTGKIQDFSIIDNETVFDHYKSVIRSIQPMSDEQPKVGKKYDENKPPLDLIPPEAIEDEAKAWGFGANKYGRYNFRSGIAYTRLIAAALRHLFALLRGEDNDPESGLPHEAHVRCCMGMLSVMKKTRTDLDDRYKG
jgi:hypothetical protein